MDKPRVLLSGTSNSALARSLNYPLTLSKEIETFTNQSYGASGSIALGVHLGEIDFAAHDFCLLDHCVNEEVWISQDLSTAEAAMNR